MAIIDVKIYSEKLRFQTNTTIIRPGDVHRGRETSDFPVIYLLHGISDDCSQWLRRTLIEYYCDKYQIIAVMPSAGNSFYVNQAFGYSYFEFISNELPDVMNFMFGISRERSKNFVAGFSMGGFGAAMTGLKNPDNYRAICSISGVLYNYDDVKWHTDNSAFPNDFALAFGKNAENYVDYNPYSLLERNISSGVEIPAFYHFCGTEDFLIDSNRKFNEFAVNKWVDYQYIETKGGHEWEVCNVQIEEFFKYLTHKSFI